MALDVSKPTVFPKPLTEVRIERIEDPERFSLIETVNGAVYGDADHARWLARR